MKKILFAAIILLCSSNIFAQSKSSSTGADLSIGVDGGFPIGSFGDGYKFGIGGTAKLGYNLNDMFAVTLQSGYISFSGKSQTFFGTTIQNPAVGFVPIKLGLRYTVNGGVYVEPQLGVSVISGGGSTTAFTYAINLGYRMTPGIDISARYEGVSDDGTASFIGLRIAYGFALGKK
jgi:hypothetical protein